MPIADEPITSSADSAACADVATILKRSLRPPYTLSSPGNPIIKQREFHGRWCIPSELADLKIDDRVLLLDTLNTIFGTTYYFRSPREPLGKVMNYCISQDYDLGTAYGMLRCWWSRISQPDFLSHFDSLERNDRERRERGVNERLVLDRHIPPRRVWDLYSNRVLPFWAANVRWETKYNVIRPWTIERSSKIQAVSHAWMSPDMRRGVISPINGNKWPVPIPADLNLDDLRIELLNLRLEEEAEYVWLDVLCLRQLGGKPRQESLRAKEWGIDVPTIGAVYQLSATTVFYLNGLGRPFEEHDLDDPRHWCNRAWTMQEWCCGLDNMHTTRSNALLGGVTEQSPRFNIERIHYSPIDTFFKEGTAEGMSQYDVAVSLCNIIEAASTFIEPLSERMSGLDLHESLENIIKAAAMMNRRQAERDLDKLAGLAYLACDRTQPVFDTTQDVEDAWLPFIDCLTPEARGQLFFMFPFAGDGRYEWTPSWKQLLSRAEEVEAVYKHTIWRKEYSPALFDNGYSCLALCLLSCRLLKLDRSAPVTNTKSRRKRRRASSTATFQVTETDSGVTFHLTARHHHSILSDRTYCLLSYVGDLDWLEPTNMRCHYWVVGFLDEQERFHKETVLESESGESVPAEPGLDVTIGTKQALPKILGAREGKANKWIRRVKLA